jgi:hypothetical protein
MRAAAAGRHERMRAAAAGRREEGAMRAAAAGVHGRLEEPGRPRHMQDRLRVLGLTGCDTGCRCGLYRASDLLYLAVQGAIPVTVAVSLMPVEASCTLISPPSLTPSPLLFQCCQ